MANLKCISVLLALLFNVNFVFGNDFFRTLNIENGLAHTDVNSICQDQTGILWFGTNAGLQNYDGYRLRTFDYYPSSNKVFRSHNRINAIASSRNKLFLGTDSGITCFDLTTYSYTNVKALDGSLLGSRVSDLVISEDRYLWAITVEGLSVALLENNKLTILNWKDTEKNEIAIDFRKLHIHNQDIWTYSKSHLYQLGLDNGEITILNKYPINELTKENNNIECISVFQDYLYIKTEKSFAKAPFSGNTLNSTATIITRALHRAFADNSINHFVIGKNEDLWCASQLGHIIEVQHPFSTSPIVRQYLSNNNANPNLSKLKIQALFLDKYDNIWAATMGWGVFHRPRVLSPFYNISNRQFQEMGFTQNQINSVTKERNGNIWMLVERSSIFYYNSKKEKLTHISMPELNIESNFYQYLYMSKDQENLYIGLSNGIAIYNIRSQKLSWLLGGKSKLLDEVFSVSCIKEDHHGRLWVASWGKGLLCISDPRNCPHIEYHYDTKTSPKILSNFISDIYINRDDVLLCTNNGLNKITLNHKSLGVDDIVTYQVLENVPTSMSSNYLAAIDCENDSIYWIGTIGGGLNRVVLQSDRKNDYTATCYTTTDGLTSNDCEIVYMDNYKNVWVGGKDITCLNTQDQTISTYRTLNGKDINYFKVGAGYKDDDGILYMGGMFGLTYFWPSQIEYKGTKLELVFTDLTINSELVVPLQSYNNSIPLTTTLEGTNKLELSHLQNSFSIYFSALGFQLTEQIKYRFRMLGYDNKWQELPFATNWISYSNFPYGDYTLELQVSNDKGKTWVSRVKQLEISILPPWWQSTIAKIGYLIITMLILFVIFYLYNKKQNLKKENEIQKIIKEQDDERYQTKMRFFMNASHELKTPLTLISLAANHIPHDEKSKKDLDTIVSNTHKMLLLINEMVNIRKTDVAISTLNLSYLNITQLTHQLLEEISFWAADKGLTLTLESVEESIEMDADRDQIGKLIINLLSNAVKHTDEGGTINVALRIGYKDSIVAAYNSSYQEGDVSQEQLLCVLNVKDTGIGISAESISYIFERFFQVNHENSNHLGSGIGLAIVKSVVLQHKGIIIVSSERGCGTEFIVAIPILKTLEQSMPSSKNLDVKQFIDNQYYEYTPSNNTLEYHFTNDDEMPTLLIVEDNISLRDMLKEHFLPFYNIQLADNGKQGLDYCCNHYPDIVISDVMMPILDGIEMCHELKNNLSTANIPVILLTAKGSVENQIEGYESGADLYIPKPFSMKLLEVNVARLLKQREIQIGEQHTETKSQIDTSTKRELINEELQVFRDRLENIINTHISNSNLSVDFLASSMNISRSKLYNLVKESFDESLADYIRNVRLQKSAYLLQHTMLNISEIMFEVGFVNSSHFSRIFKQRFGLSPSEYSKREL